MGTEQSVFGHMTSPGQWAGGFAAWDEFGVYFATGRAESPGRVLRVESAQLRRLAEQWFPFGLHFIHGLVNTVRRIESTARQREALVALVGRHVNGANTPGFKADGQANQVSAERLGVIDQALELLVHRIADTGVEHADLQAEGAGRTDRNPLPPLNDFDQVAQRLDHPAQRANGALVLMHIKS